MWSQHLCSSSLQEEQNARSRKSGLIASGVSFPGDYSFLSLKQTPNTLGIVKL